MNWRIFQPLSIGGKKNEVLRLILMLSPYTAHGA